MAKGKGHKRKSRTGGARKPRTPAVIKAYSGSGYHSPGKYSKADRKSGSLEIRRAREE